MLRRLLYAFCLAATLLTVASCINDDYAPEDVGTPEKKTYQIKFTLNLGGERRASRAATRAGEDDDKKWGDDHAEEEADRWENTIQAGKLKILAVDSANNVYLGEVENLSAVRDADKDYIYNIIGNLNLDGMTEDTYTFKGKLVVVANYDDNFLDFWKNNDIVKGQTKLSDGLFNNYGVYSFQQERVNNRTQNIPMFGVKSYTGKYALSLVAGKQKDAGTINMLRALAKIRVTLDKKLIDDGWTLEPPILSIYNKQGGIFPGGYATVNNTEDLGLESSLNIPQNCANSLTNKTLPSDPMFQLLPLKNGVSYIAYVPEYENKTQKDGDERELAILYSVVKDGETAKTGRLVIGDYENGKLTQKRNVVRNTIYEYILSTEDKDATNITLKYQVMPWTEVKGNIEFN